MDKTVIRDIVKQVLQELSQSGGGNTAAKTARRRRPPDGPRILNLFHAGVGKLETALEQVGQIESIAARSSVYTAGSARSWVCGGDVRDRSGTRCILDTVAPDGLQRVLEKTDILVLPTFCFKVAAKVARLTCDTEDSSLVLSALMRGKTVVATRDGFLFLESLANEALKTEVQAVLDKLESFGMVLCSTAELFQTVKSVSGKPSHGAAPSKGGKQDDSAQAGVALVTAKEIQAAVDARQSCIRVAPGGIVTPLARDQAREYGIGIEPLKGSAES